MHNVVSMTVVDATEDLLNEHSSVAFSELTSSKDLFEEFSTLTDLLYDVVTFLIFEEFKHLNNIGVIQFLKNVDFVEEHAAFILVHVTLLENLNGSLCSGVTMDTHSHFTECALSKDFTNTIVVSEFTLILLNRVLGTD